jgi:hypothetical protein
MEDNSPGQGQVERRGWEDQNSRWVISLEEEEEKNKENKKKKKRKKNKKFKMLMDTQKAFRRNQGARRLVLDFPEVRHSKSI